MTEEKDGVSDRIGWILNGFWVAGCLCGWDVWVWEQSVCVFTICFDGF